MSLFQKYILGLAFCVSGGILMDSKLFITGTIFVLIGFMALMMTYLTYGLGEKMRSDKQ